MATKRAALAAGMAELGPEMSGLVSFQASLAEDSAFAYRDLASLRSGE